MNLSSNLMISNDLHQRLVFMVAKASTQKTSIERCYKLCGPVDPWIQSNSGKVCELGYSLEWLCSFLKFFQVIELLESMQLSCRDQFGTKVEFSAGYTKTHSLPHKILAFRCKTITKNWELSASQNSLVLCWKNNIHKYSF